MKGIVTLAKDQNKKKAKEYFRTLQDIFRIRHAHRTGKKGAIK